MVGGLEERGRVARERAGATRVPFDFLPGEFAVATYYLVATAEASSNLARFDGVRYGFRHEQSGDVRALYTNTRSAGFGPEVQRRILLGTYALSAGYYDAYYLTAQKARTRIRTEYDERVRAVRRDAAAGGADACRSSSARRSTTRWRCT